ncbi:MAG TPA: NADH-quinone oxidoreductase subunit NuoE [Candidatus Eisenbacteria bacterium]|jgi:NADH-quinone oxidoreductase subunit E|nr:NADH-quinone oxidoreductase subunit NuoE [Candidatus Eisenbacteria bacterium]
MALSDKAKKQIRDLLQTYETNQSALIPALHVAQGDQGWLSEETQREVAEVLELSAQEVRGVVSFYTMFLQKPAGKYLLQVCRNLSCSLRGGHRLTKQLEDKLQIKQGETTTDGKFTLIEVECLGSCGTAPVMMVNDKYVEDLTPQALDKMIAELT